MFLSDQNILEVNTFCERMATHGHLTVDSTAIFRAFGISSKGGVY